MKSRPPETATPEAQQRTYNPFPTFPVTSLRDIADDIVKATFTTGAVLQARNACRLYLAEYFTERRAPCLQPVRGDYGAGKTHLLLYARETLLAEPPDQAVTVSVSAVETEFPDWFRSTLGPALFRLNLPELMVAFYAQAAIVVAERTEITRVHVPAIEASPGSVFTMLRDGLLSRSAIDELATEWIADIIPDASNEVRRALLALTLEPGASAAARWLTAASPRDADANLLGILRPLDAENEGALIAAAVAGVCNRLSRPFALLIDEFEHLVAVDINKKARRNATWLKRLIEAIAAQNAFVMVAGHWTAWDAQRADFSARFPTSPPIIMVELNRNDVVDLALQLAPDWAKDFPDNVAEMVSFAAHGNIRRILAFLRNLFLRQPQNASTLTDQDVVEALRSLPPTATDAVLDRVRRLTARATQATSLNLTETWMGGDGAPYDMAILRNGRPVGVLEIKTAVTQGLQFEMLHAFAGRIASLRRLDPNLQGLLVLSGATDPDALSFVSRLPAVTALTAEAPDFDIALESFIYDLRNSAPPPTTDDVDHIDEYSIRSTLSGWRDEAVRNTAETRTRLKTAAADPDIRQAAVASAVLDEFDSPANVHKSDRGRDIVDAMLNRVDAPKLSDVLTRRPVYITAVILSLSVATISTIVLFGFPEPYYYFRFYLLAAVPTSIALLAMTSTLIFLTYSREVRAFKSFVRWRFNFLEELYISGADEIELIRARNIISRAPDEVGGFTDAVPWAQKAVSRSFDVGIAARVRA